MSSRTLLSSFLVLASWLPSQAGAGPSTDALPAVEDYLIGDVAAEIALARTAAPAEVAGGAAVMVLGRDGYREAEPGGNGFVCLVLRSWNGPYENPEFWNPRQRGPVCYNPPATRSVLPADLLRTDLALSGLDRAAIRGRMAEAYGNGLLRPPEPSSMAFMLSPAQHLGDRIGAWKPHLMLFVPYGSFSEWGATGLHTPCVPFDGEGGPLTTLVVPVAAWSDGTPLAAVAPGVVAE